MLDPGAVTGRNGLNLTGFDVRYFHKLNKLLSKKENHYENFE